MGVNFKLLLFTFLVGLGLIFFSSETYALTTYWDVPVPENYSIRPVQECLDDGAAYSQCANSLNVGNCGLPDCEKGLDWTKYTLTCAMDPDTEILEAHYLQGEKICSIGDKCELGEQGLRYGQCDCGYSFQRYKVCCSDGTSAVCENSPSILQDGTYPPEGQCPSGTTETFCGFDPYPPCDSACGAPRQCNELNRTYNQCCGDGLSQEVQEYVWDDGSGEVCNYVPGACNQVDSSCGGSYNTSCTNLSVAQGSSGTSNVTLTLASGTIPSVGSFSVSGLPAGASTTFSPTSCAPNCSTTMTISTTSSTPAGNYTISVNGSPSAAAKNTCTLTISGCTLPTVDVKANNSNGPVDIANNTPATISWSSTNATSCTASGAWSGSKSVSGGGDSQSTGNLPGPNSYNYALTCSNSCGSNSDVVVVNVGGGGIPTCSVSGSATYNSSTSQYTTNLSWTASNMAGSTDVWYYNPGTCSLSSCPTTGWTHITSGPDSGSSNGPYPWTSGAPAAGSTHTFAVTDASDSNRIVCVNNVNYPATASTGCSLSANPSEPETGTSTTISLSPNIFSGPRPADAVYSLTFGDGASGSFNLSGQASHSYSSSGIYSPRFSANSASDSTFRYDCSTSVSVSDPGSGSPPSPPFCQTPPDDAPVVTANGDGTVTVSYSYPGDFRADNLQANFYRNPQPGFIFSGGNLIGNQFGNHGVSFQGGLNPQTYYNYQLEATNGTGQVWSQALALVTDAAEDKTGSSPGAGATTSQAQITGATLISSTSISMTFNLFYKVDDISAFQNGCPALGCEPYAPPPYLKVVRASGGTALIPWYSIDSRSQSCGYLFNGRCYYTNWTVRYTVALPPGTLDTFTISSESNGGQRWRMAIGQATIQCGAGTNCGTTAGASQALMSSPTLSGTSGQVDQTFEVGTDDPAGLFWTRINWSPTAQGHQTLVYTNEGYNGRWPSTTPVTANYQRSFDAGTGRTTFSATDNLAGVPSGTYYYGADLFKKNWCSRVKTAQAPFIWVKPINAWIQTTGGDVHSNIRINTPGGP